MYTITDVDIPNTNDHIWVKISSEISALNGAIVCKKCGYERREDGNNQQCPGFIKLAFR